MADLLGKELTEELRSMLELGATPRTDDVLALITVDAGGCPRVCLLSPYQVVGIGAKTICLAVYSTSKTARNLARSRRACMMMVTPPSVHYIVGRISRLKRKDELGNSFYSMKVMAVSRDFSERAPISSRFTFDATTVRPFYERVYKGLADAARATEGV